MSSQTLALFYLCFLHVYVCNPSDIVAVNITNQSVTIVYSSNSSTIAVYISGILYIGRQKRYSEDDICLESRKTVAKASDCPTDIETMKERSKNKNCSRYPTCVGKPLAYHCVISNRILVEVCAPRNQITGRCCPMYNEELGMVIEDYKRPCSKCPFQYQSDDFNNSKECLRDQTLTDSRNISEDSNPKQDREKKKDHFSTDRQDKEKKEDHFSTDRRDKEKKENHINVSPGIFIFIIYACILVVLFLVLTLYLCTNLSNFIINIKQYCTETIRAS
eukprot:XP_011442218.1 PREDICTED: uncharacterized protein LOC105338688 [Crassostrea gigas]